jgi:hypothetical protein
MLSFFILLFLASLGFAWTFACPYGNFWIKITTTVCVLCAGSFTVAGFPIRRAQHLLREMMIGLVAAVVLYGIFWLGDFSAAYPVVPGIAPDQSFAVHVLPEV